MEIWIFTGKRPISEQDALYVQSAVSELIIRGCFGKNEPLDSCQIPVVRSPDTAKESFVYILITGVPLNPAHDFKKAAEVLLGIAKVLARKHNIEKVRAELRIGLPDQIFTNQNY